jgi:8-oxo-dGTP pyrophosphatase MutT (NUDIX family)
MPSREDRFSICLLEDSDHRLLFLKRSLTETIGPGKWGFPAGHIEDGESPLECGLRELDEEIGPDHVLDLRRSIGPVRDTFFGGRFELHLFHYNWREGTVKLNEEHTDFRWMSSGQFDKLDAMLGIEQDIVLLDIWPAGIFDPARLGHLPTF